MVYNLFLKILWIDNIGTSADLTCWNFLHGTEMKWFLCCAVVLGAILYLQFMERKKKPQLNYTSRIFTTRGSQYKPNGSHKTCNWEQVLFTSWKRLYKVFYSLYWIIHKFSWEQMWKLKNCYSNLLSSFQWRPISDCSDGKIMFSLVYLIMLASENYQ